MKKILFVIFILVLVTHSQAADTKTTTLTELTAVADTDILYIVDDPGGTPLSKKITALNLFDMINTFAKLDTIVTDKTLTNLEDAMTWVALGTFNLGITITTGDPFTLGTTRWDDGSDKIDGEQIANDTIDNDSIDWSDMTDLTTDGAVSWGNLGAGELADDSVNDDDINWADLTYLTTNGAGINEAYASGWNADVGPPEKDDIYDYLHNFDADDDGSFTDETWFASGETLIIFRAQSNEPPASSFATLDTRNSIPVLDFDADADETAEFGGFMSRRYHGGGVTVTLGWMATDTTVTPHNCIWDVAFKSVTNDADDLDSKAYAAVNSVTDAEASASGEISYCTIAFTDGADMDSVAAGEYFRLKVTRDADNGSDSLTDDAELVFVEIKED